MAARDDDRCAGLEKRTNISLRGGVDARQQRRDRDALLKRYQVRSGTNRAVDHVENSGGTAESAPRK